MCLNQRPEVVHVRLDHRQEGAPACHLGDRFEIAVLPFFIHGHVPANRQEPRAGKVVQGILIQGEHGASKRRIRRSLCKRDPETECPAKSLDCPATWRRIALACLNERVDPKTWRIHAPSSGSRGTLAVEFDRPLDRALLGRCLGVQHDDVAVPGAATISDGERCWRFQPSSAWQAGQYVLTIDPSLEDLAGNSLTRVFDRDLTLAGDSPADAPLVAIEFRCR